jgi:hypothetical protein
MDKNIVGVSFGIRLLAAGEVAAVKAAPGEPYQPLAVAAARCPQRNRNADVQVLTVGNTNPRFRLQAENRIGFSRSGLSNVTACARFDRAQRRPRIGTIPEGRLECDE